MNKKQIFKDLKKLPRRFKLPCALNSIHYIPDFQGKISPDSDSFEICIQIPTAPRNSLSASGRKISREKACIYFLNPDRQTSIPVKDAKCDIMIFSYSEQNKDFLKNCAIYHTENITFVISPILTGLMEEILIRLQEINILGNGDRLDYLAMEYLLEASLNSRAENPSTSNNRKWDFFLEIALYTDSHIMENITIEELCSHFSISRRTLFRFWKQHFSSTPAAYISHRRAEIARRLLQRTDLNNYEIAERCGYGSPTYFSSSFRHQTGMSPSEYRKTLLH